MTKGLDCEWSVNGGLSDFLDEALKLLLTKGGNKLQIFLDVALKLLLTKGGNILHIRCLSVPEYLEAVRLAEWVYGNIK